MRKPVLQFIVGDIAEENLVKKSSKQYCGLLPHFLASPSPKSM